MKSLLQFFTLVLCFVAFTNAQAQSQVPTFRIISTLPSANLTKYETAIQNADMEAYRLKTTSNILSFDDGVQVEFFAADVLAERGVSINANNYTDDKGVNYVNPILHIAEGGSIVAMYPVASPK